jgi:L-ascorbate metabolism protein UlaG (beta-lactamase superfamily)
MDITWYGLSCFRMSERGMATVVTDPFAPEYGLPSLKLKADIVTISHDAPGHNYLKGVKGERRAINGPGEYEVGGVFITGITMSGSKKNGTGENTLYVFDFEGVTVAHLGDLSHVPSQAEIEDLGAVDIALVPVGGGSALKASEAAEVISLIEPSIVVPMHYKVGKIELKLSPVTRFLSEMGLTQIDPLPVLKVSKGSLSEETQVVVLQPAS